MCGVTGTCGCGKNNIIGGTSLSDEADSKFGKGGPSGCLSGYGCAGEGTWNYDFFQAGANCGRRFGTGAFGYSGACGFLCGDGADPAGTGLCNPCDQWNGWCAGTYENPLETSSPLPCANTVVHQ